MYDVEPQRLPNLYHGTPLRLYGRYRGSGQAKLRLEGQLQGVKWEQEATLELPAEDAANPEIERMWAWHRIDDLVKAGERGRMLDQVKPEIVRLGQAFSIVSEYTSFLVLENNAEYQRWKIDRRNALRTTRDRAAQAQVTATLAALREKAVAGLGPQEPAPAPTPASTAPAQFTLAAAPAPTPLRSQSRDFNVPNGGVGAGSPATGPSRGGGGGGGSGPVGPLFVLVAAWLARRRTQSVVEPGF